MNKPTHVRYLVMAWMCLFAMIAYVQRGCLAVPAIRIQEELGISRDAMAWAMSSFLWGYALFQLPGGWLGDRFGSRGILPLLMIFSSLATGLSALAWGWLLLMFSRAYMGLAQAGMFPCAVLTHARWFPPGERAAPNGMLASFMSVGGVASTAFTAWLLQYLTWREVFVAFMVPGIVLALAFYVWFRNDPAQHSWVNAEELHLIRSLPTGAAPPTVDPGRSTPWLQLGQDLRLWLICGQQFFRAAGYIFYMTWFPTFLVESRHLDPTMAGYFASFPLLGVVVGSALGGMLTDWIFRRSGSLTLSRKSVAIVSLLACAALLASAYFVQDATLAVTWITFSAFFAGLCGPAAYTATIDLGGKHVATVFSVMNMAGNIGAALLPILVVRFEQLIRTIRVTQMGIPKQIEVGGVPLDNLEFVLGLTGQVNGWNEVLFFLAGLYVAAALCWVFLRMDGGAISDRRDRAVAC